MNRVENEDMFIAGIKNNDDIDFPFTEEELLNDLVLFPSSSTNPSETEPAKVPFQVPPPRPFGERENSFPQEFDEQVNTQAPSPVPTIPQTLSDPIVLKEPVNDAITSPLKPVVPSSDPFAVETVDVDIKPPPIPARNFRTQIIASDDFTFL